MASFAIMVGAVSCKSSSSFDKDVRKRGEYMCTIQKLTAKGGTDEASIKALEKAKKELDEYDATMEKKYKDKEPTKEQQESAEKILKEVMDKCK